MATTSATIAGWACRASKVWYPSSGVAATSSMPSGVNAVASCPTTTATGSTSSGNKYTTMIAITTPNSAGISSISQISITFKVYKGNSTSGTLYGSLRTVDQASGSTASDTVSTYRVNAVGDEAALTFAGTTQVSKTMTFSGSFSKNTTYYLFLYTKSTSDIYFFVSGSSNFSSTITYTATTYTISYNANGGSNAPSSQTKTYGTTLTLTTSKPTPPSSTTSNTTSNFTITGDGNGGYFGSTSTTTTSITATATTPKTTTYTFNNWNTNSAGTGTSYASGGSYTANAAATLYAQYTSSTSTGTTTYTNNVISGLATPSRANSTQATYTITFDANGGSCSTTSLSSSKVRSYTYKGWAESSTATTALANTTTYTAAKTLYAVWGYTDSTAAITLPTPTRSGYEFMGWATSTSASSGSTGSYTPTASITLYAIWKQSYSTIYYNDNGNVVACSVYYNNNGTAILCNVYYNNNGSAVQI